MYSVNLPSFYVCSNVIKCIIKSFKWRNLGYQLDLAKYHRGLRDNVIEIVLSCTLGQELCLCCSVLKTFVCSWTHMCIREHTVSNLVY